MESVHQGTRNQMTLHTNSIAGCYLTNPGLFSGTALVSWKGSPNPYHEPMHHAHLLNPAGHGLQVKFNAERRMRNHRRRRNSRLELEQPRRWSLRDAMGRQWYPDMSVALVWREVGSGGESNTISAQGYSIATRYPEISTDVDPSRHPGALLTLPLPRADAILIVCVQGGR